MYLEKELKEQYGGRNKSKVSKRFLTAIISKAIKLSLRNIVPLDLDYTHNYIMEFIIGNISSYKFTAG